MADFSRSINQSIIDNLKKEKLFIKCLRPDIEAGQVFMAIRGGYVSFYYKGGSLFTYKGKRKGVFESHFKYAFVPQPINTPYVRENKLADMTQRDNFTDAYEQIKERCALYAGLEAAGVSELHRFSYAKKPRGQYVLLDTEIALDAVNDKAADAALAISEGDRAHDTKVYASPENQSTLTEKKRSTDRIDMLLMNEEGRLLFCEAKHFSNAELASAVEDQLRRYRNQIEAKRSDIIAQYREYVTSVNQLLDLKLLPPRELCDNCGLLIFGYDSDQERGRLAEIRARVKANGYPVYTMGNISGIKTAETLFTALA